VTPSESAASQRECGCPEWVLRCVHFSGRCIVLVGPSEHDSHGPPSTIIKLGSSSYLVIDADRALPCGCGAPLIGAMRREPRYYMGNDHAVALAAFHAAESRLLAEAELEREGMGHVSVARAGGE
jgi:hypothetical protein